MKRMSPRLDNSLYLDMSLRKSYPKVAFLICKLDKIQVNLCKSHTVKYKLCKFYCKDKSKLDINQDIDSGTAIYPHCRQYNSQEYPYKLRKNYHIKCNCWQLLNIRWDNS